MTRKRRRRTTRKRTSPKAADGGLGAGTAVRAEWRYTLTPPQVRAQAATQDEKIALGPAVLTEQFSAAKDGAVEAHLSFDSVKRRYTVAEATELRNKLAELVSGPAILVNFEPRARHCCARQGAGGAGQLSQPGGAAPQRGGASPAGCQGADGSGMGEAARAEAREAVKLDPKSALAEKTLAQILKHGPGRPQYASGQRPGGAAEAYRAAIRLDPTTTERRGPGDSAGI